MTTIRVLQSLSTLDRGGAEAMVMNVYRNIDRQKIQFDFVVNDQPSPYAFEEEVKQLGGRIFKVPKFNGRNFSLYRKAMDQLFEKHLEWAIVHIHNTSSAMLFIDIAKKYGVKTIAHAHFDQDMKDFRSYAQKVFRMPIKKYADRLLACSKLAGVHVFNIPIEEVQVLNNAIETDKYIYNEKIRKRKRTELGIKYEMVLGHIGRMDTEKNQLYVLEVFKEYHQLNPKSFLLLIGKGELEETLKQKVAEYDLINEVKFLGIRWDVNEWLQAMDIFIFPSIFEGLPVALIEAQAAGLPIIASDQITKEVAITPLITFKSIEIEPYYWAKKIDDQYIMLRGNMTEAIVKAGYDVKDTVKELQDLYLTMIEDGD